MTAKDLFVNRKHLAMERCAFAWDPSIAILGYEDYDVLFSEVRTSITDVMACNQSNMSLELQRKRVPHFYYQGILVTRSPFDQTGFHFA